MALDVSILILLEIVLEEFQKLLPPQRPGSFNPYSAGDSSGSSTSGHFSSVSSGFNPYSAGDSSGRKITMLHQYYSIRFNPYSAGDSSGRRKGAW